MVGIEQHKCVTQKSLTRDNWCHWLAMQLNKNRWYIKVIYIYIYIYTHITLFMEKLNACLVKQINGSSYASTMNKDLFRAIHN